MIAAILAGLALVAPPEAAGLPLLRVDAPRGIPDEPKVTAQLRMPGYRGRIGIEQRGQSSRRLFPKKSFAIELRDAKGEDRKVPLLGMPDDGDWVLYGPYNDKTLMRNVVAYRTARWMGRYAARTRFVRLRLNGRYHGVYVLMEKLELGADRVRGEALYEFTFPFQAQFKDPSFVTPVKRRPIVWEDPERGDLTRGRAQRLARPVRRAARALYGPGSWRRWIDAGSAVDFALVNELFKNQDGFHGSTYMSLGEDGRLRMGPVWDFDIAMGNSDYGPSSRLRGWMLRHRDWVERMYRDRAFASRMARRWRELRRAGLRSEVLGIVRRSQSALRGAVVPNFRRWPILDRRIWPNPRARGSHRAEVRFLRSWLSRRIRWIDRNVGRL
ncbi:MAG: CotH kinase family protein [Solirubrobacteraceae bacterium]